MPEYTELSLHALVSRIVNSHDVDALDELLARRSVCRSQSGAMVTVPDYIDELRKRLEDRSRGWPTEVTEHAANLTIDKFSRLGDSGTDCRFYYCTFLGTAIPEDPSLEVERQNSVLLQRFVRWQFSLSFKDALRRRTGYSRFYWEEQGAYLWFPQGIPVEDRRHWLSACDDGGRRQLDRSEIRAIQRLIWDEVRAPVPVPRRDGHVVPWAVAHDVTTRGIAEAVAREKAANIAHQRPSIRELGPSRLYLLVLRIFDAVERGSDAGADLAREYGLTESTFSRFAGRNWRRTTRKTPDLWRNAAEVLAATPKFVEAARDAGVWPQVQALAREE